MRVVSHRDIDVTVGDVPQDFKVRELEKDFVARKEMIPMRDGVKLNTLIVIPKGAKNAPILMDRTPYNIGIYEPYVAADQFLLAGYIRVYQDMRGKHGSEGNYIVTMPLRGPLNPGVGRSLDRYLGHDRVAGEERARVERPRRHDGLLVRGLHDGDGADRSASGAQGGGAAGTGDRRMDGRRLVSLRRVPHA